MKKKGIFIAATGQNVGKTTLCLGIISGLMKKFPMLGFMKPVGQQHEKVTQGLLVDKDVVLFKEYFHLPSHYEDMSPVIFPSGFTRDFLDGAVDPRILEDKISSAFEVIYRENDFTIVEGTGHVGVGSIVTLSNARIAKLLDLDVVLIARGGIGSAFDELALNKCLCDQMGVKIRGVILNKVLEEKREMVLHYFPLALARWKIPLIGAIPYDSFLSLPSMEDFESLFDAHLISGEEFPYRHFASIRLVASSLETFKELIHSNQLLITPATREDIIEAIIERQKERGTSANGLPEHGLILTGPQPPSPRIIEKLKETNIPCIYAPVNSFEAMRRITSFTAKIKKEDISKIEEAIQLVENHLDFSFFT